MLSFIFFIPILAPFLALLLGLIALSKITKSNGTLSGHGFAWAGIVLSGLQLIASTFLCYLLFTYQTPAEIIAKKVSTAIDSNDPIVRDFAVNIAKKHPGELNYKQIFAIYSEIRKNWKYVNDPMGTEYFSPASKTIKLGLAGDCDDFAILMAATLQAIGAKTRIVAAYATETGHAYAEVNIDQDAQGVLNALQSQYNFLFIPLVYEINYKESDDGNWMNLDWFSNYPGGKYFESLEDIIIYTDGKFRKMN